MIKANTDFYEVVYSPDDEAESGKGWYAYTIHKNGAPAEESELFRSAKEAEDWAKAHGGRRFLGDLSY